MIRCVRLTAPPGGSFAQRPESEVARSNGNPELWLWGRVINRLHRWICRSAFWRESLQSEILPWALKDCDLGQNLLEVGPGPGLTTDFLRTRFDRMTALEVDPALSPAEFLTKTSMYWGIAHDYWRSRPDFRGRRPSRVWLPSTLDFRKRRALLSFFLSTVSRDVELVAPT